jgi:succinyl-CoA synthetase beta subunit
VKLHEYQSKRVFAKYGVPIPNGDVATSPAEAQEIAKRLGGRVVVKSQVQVCGRGKAGGKKVAKDAYEAERLAEKIFGITIKGIIVDKVEIEEAADI